MIVYAKGYNYSYILYEDRLKVIKDTVMMNHEMNVNERIGSTIVFNSVRSLKLNSDKGLIEIRGLLIWSTVYANKEEIEKIYNMIKKRCSKPKS